MLTGDAKEHYVMPYFREATEKMGNLFGRDARPFVQFFMKMQLEPILWRLVKEAEERGRRQAHESNV